MNRSIPYPVSPDDPILIEIMHKDTLVASSREYGGENWGRNNTMKVSFTVREAGTYRISILARGMPIRGSPFKKDFLPGKNTYVSAIVVVLKTESFAKVSHSLLIIIISLVMIRLSVIVGSLTNAGTDNATNQ